MPAPAAPPAPAEPARGSSIGRLILGSDTRRRRFVRMLLITGSVYAGAIAMLVFGSYQGLFEPVPAIWLGSLMATTVLLLYAIFRSGWNERFADPTLAAAQSIAAQTLIAGAYGVIGPVHSGTLVLFPMVLFFAMFDIKPRYGRWIALYTVALVGAVMWWRCQTLPALYRPAIEIIYFVLLSTSMFAVIQIATQSSHLRAKLKSQKAALQQALAHIEQISIHDELTGLPNRRHILAQLDEHVLRQARGGPAFHIAIADLDHFKRINDSLGHSAGDQALRTFAQQARAQLRTTDVIGRWGGEEFLVLLPDNTQGDPGVALERLRATLAETMVCEQAPALRVQFSAGLSRYREGENVADAIERADQALYAAKAAGRNRTVTA